MGPIHAGLLSLLFCSVYCYKFGSRGGHSAFMQDPELEWEGITETFREKTEAPAPKPKLWKPGSDSGSSTPLAKEFPEYVIVSASKDQTKLFKPEKGARPLPESVKEMLLSPKGTTRPVAGSDKAKIVEVLCHVDRMYVRVKRELFKSRDAYKYLKLGSCPVNQGNKDYYYLLYSLKSDCGFKKMSDADCLFISIKLNYNPDTPVLREMPFDINLQCKFPRFFHSYKVGFYPKLRGGTVYRQLQSKGGFTLTLQDASGKEITGTKTYTMGQPMHFKASGPDRMESSGNMRLYINKCYMTTSQNPNSSPKYTVIDNQGCMIDGKVTPESKFLTSDSKRVQKFTVAAFILKDGASTPSSQQLYMHCQISIGPLTPTQSAKACNYDPENKKWKERYGSDSVCICCASTCPSAKPKASRNVTSTQSWKVGLSSRDEYVEADPQMKSSDGDPFTTEDADLVEHRDYLNNWDHDY